MAPNKPCCGIFQTVSAGESALNPCANRGLGFRVQGLGLRDGGAAGKGGLAQEAAVISPLGYCTL